ncbi:beta-ketothiolase BktB [Parvularcula sp. LCG005]|uniref:beta-ketothiolase BktB n=1 Tax=Parvularcula sp. LCG005 TaxID=3078805 RepID=UPI002942F579|nr:beta-ketothiolase BktB [Parvularcula sp. LCG005]WOI54565.1 beta-ketothiolase BktB [Parvularcula sp. LCG005]
MTQDVYILSAARTAVGRFGGGFADVPLEDLGTHALKAAIERSGVQADQVESAVVGNVLRTQSKDVYLARTMAISAGMAESSHAVTVNRLCGSGLEAIVQASQQIMLGDVSVAVAGGAESMSRTTYSSSTPRFGQKMGPVTLDDDMLAALSDPFGSGHMGMTAENVSEQFGIDRAAQDAFAEESHRRAIHAIDNGYFREQIVPFEIATRKGTTVIDTDEHARRDVTAQGLSALKPAFKRDGGTVTAGNASGLNDGASMLTLASGDIVKQGGLQPMAKLVSYARAGVAPSIMGTGPIPAVKLALARTGLSVDDIDVIESNEAFAAQACAVAKELNFPAEKTNPNGGAVALGHPIGATGAIITTKCLYELKRTGGRYGLVTLCIGGGQGIAAIFENVQR